MVGAGEKSLKEGKRVLSPLKSGNCIGHYENFFLSAVDENNLAKLGLNQRLRKILWSKNFIPMQDIFIIFYLFFLKNIYGDMNIHSEKAKNT